ncbi:MAG: peptide ABC transporter permease, partial [Candidatus Methylopumilus sp.]
MKKIIQNPLALSGLIIIISILFIAIFAPWLS